MNKIKIELNSEGVRELLKSPEMKKVLDQYARDLGMIGYNVVEYKKRAIANSAEKDAKRNGNRESDKGLS